MNKTAGSKSCFPDLSHLSGTIAELYQGGVDEICAIHIKEKVPVSIWDEDKNPDAAIYPEAGFPCRTNPFDATMVAFDESASKLTILLSLSKPLLVIAELYGPDGRFIKRLFNKRMERGLTEIIGRGRRQQKRIFMILLHSSEGMRSFRIQCN
jgi:hypothetical protein